jgi:hypothetical protein
MWCALYVVPDRTAVVVELTALAVLARIPWLHCCEHILRAAEASVGTFNLKSTRTTCA